MRLLRGSWRTLTSMRTALILLLLLAIAAIPGSLLPQSGVSVENVRAYLRTHPGSGPWLQRLGFFDVYASPWFSAIYLLLFISLVGCLIPRLRQHIQNLVAQPPDAPARPERLPHSAAFSRPGDPRAAADGLAADLRRLRWRTAVRDQPDGTVTVAAEKGYLKETGNLVFHFALLALLVGVALGSWYGWHGNRLVVAGDDFAFCNNLQQYDEYGLGARIAAEDLPPFCVTLNDFHAQYLDNGQPVQFIADISYVDSPGAQPKPWRLEVNEPLRLGGANVYLLGHGYAPVLRYTDRHGVSQTAVAVFLPNDALLTSSGVAKFPDANLGDAGGQVAFAGIYLPTMPRTVDGQLSAFPAERDPGLQLTAYQGNLGLGSGLPQSVYELDQRQIDAGALAKVAESKVLRPGQTWTLPDGTSVQFLGTKQWITVSVRHDPGEPIVLGGAGALLVGLMVSLTGRRRRVWARVRPTDGGRSLISLGGLARSGSFEAEFDRLAAAVGAVEQDAPQPLATAMGGGPERRGAGMTEKGT